MRVMFEKNRMFKWKKNEKGAITLFLLIAILFFLIVLQGMYTNLKNKNLAQILTIEKIERNYNDISMEEMKEIYNRTLNKIVY